MTLEEAKQIAREVVEGGKTHESAATSLARFVLSLQAVRPILPPDEMSMEDLLDELGD